jgi:hypothetical protein
MTMTDADRTRFEPEMAEIDAALANCVTKPERMAALSRLLRDQQQRRRDALLAALTSKRSEG